MRTLRFAPTLLALALALTSQYAHAWKSPQKAVDEFLKFELEGGRMQSPYAGEKYLVSPPTNEAAGKKTIALVKEYKIMSFNCKGKDCEVRVKFWFTPNKNAKNGSQPLEQHVEGDSTLITYTVHRMENNSWLVENDLGTPMVAEETIKKTMQNPIIPTSGRGK